MSTLLVLSKCAPLEKWVKDLFKNLKEQSLEFMTPSSSNTFLIPNTNSVQNGHSPTCHGYQNPHLAITFSYLIALLASRHFQ